MAYINIKSKIQKDIYSVMPSVYEEEWRNKNISFYFLLAT